MRVPFDRLLWLTLVLGSPAWAQVPAADSASAAPTPSPPELASEAPDSPRASVRRYIELAGVEGDYPRAARYLALDAGEKSRGPELARRLRAVLERRLDVHLDALSPESKGASEDGLPSGVDTLGEIPDGRGRPDPMFLVRSHDEAGAYWAFSRQTVSRIDGWYDALPDRWIRERVPEQLQRYGPSQLMWWQWLALPALVVLALALGRGAGALSRATLLPSPAVTST